MLEFELKAVGDIPEMPGVYAFCGRDKNLPLYVGKSINLRKRVRSHIYMCKREYREGRIVDSSTHVKCLLTSGEFSALLCESLLVKKLNPIFNRKLRKTKVLYTLVQESKNGYKCIKIKKIYANNIGGFGLFRSKRQALEKVIAKCVRVCACVNYVLYDNIQKPCFNFQINKCCGTCRKKCDRDVHNHQVEVVLASFADLAWPFSSSIRIEEGVGASKSVFHVDSWVIDLKKSYFAGSLEFKRIVGQESSFDIDSYKLVVDAISGKFSGVSLIYKGQMHNTML